jgi:nucleoside-diphosphate-sugar epimerase
MRVLITGGTGFIGSRLALACLRTGFGVTVLGQENSIAEARNRELIEFRGAHFVSASVTDKDHVSHALLGVDCVYHLAAAQHEANVSDRKFWEVNVEGTRNLLEASTSAGVRRFVHGSTIGVYGSLGGEINENSPSNPDNIYGITKLEAEKLVLSFQDKLPVVVIRISETYGPGDYRLLKLFKAIRKGVFVMLGDGRNTHHLIYIEDLIEGLLLAATVKEAIGNVFVLSGKAPLTTREMVEIIANELGKTIPRIRIPISPVLAAARITEAILKPLGIQPPLHRRRMDFFRKSFVFSACKPEKVLGFVPRVSFDRGVAETSKWYREMGYL